MMPGLTDFIPEDMGGAGGPGGGGPGGDGPDGAQVRTPRDAPCDPRRDFGVELMNVRGGSAKNVTKMA